jgi:hypothetical protein
MHKSTSLEIEIRDLGEMLAALCQVAQDAAGAEGASQSVERSRPLREGQTGDERGSRI